MELKDFVSASLIQIIDGVTVAQEHASKNKARVAPPIAAGPKDSLLRAGDHRPVQAVEFDVAVTATDRDIAEGQVGILVATLGIGIKGKEETENIALSRIKFVVPLELPQQGKDWQ